MKRADLFLQGTAFTILGIALFTIFSPFILYLADLAKNWPGTSWLSPILAPGLAIITFIVGLGLITGGALKHESVQVDPRSNQSSRKPAK